MKRPWVTLHFAQSLDGGMASRTGPGQLSCVEGRHLAHRLRSEHDAVIVGAHTVQTDDPELTVRCAGGASPRPVVFSSTLHIMHHARILQRSDLLVLGAENRVSPAALAYLTARQIEHAILRAGPSGIAIDAALEALLARGINRVLVEGGPRILASFLAASACDELSIEVCPILLGDGAPSLAQTLSAVTPSLQIVASERLGPHLHLRAVPLVTAEAERV